jgi:hypothetical protein
MLVIPYSIGLLFAVAVLISDRGPNRARSVAWIALPCCILLGCLTDWHAYFTAFITFLVVLVLAAKGRIQKSTGFWIAAFCCLCVGMAIATYVLQNSRIGGFGAFLQTARGRAAERIGASAKGMGLTSLDYYRSVAKYYVGYAPFLLASGILLLVSLRKGGEQTLRLVLRRVGVPLLISTLAVVVDHLVLANHTAAHSFTTLNDLVPIGLLMTVAVTVFLRTMNTNSEGARSSLIVCGLLAASLFASVGEYYIVYFHRPHPFRTAGARILSAAQPSDVLFATWDNAIVRQMIFYTGRNIELVSNANEAARYLSCHRFGRGTLAYFREDWTVEKTDVILPSPDGCPTGQLAHRM